MSNRILNGIAAAERGIADKGLSPRAQADLSAKLSVDVGDYCQYQEIKSFAHASGVITFDEAQTVYAILGESLDTFNGATLAQKIVVTKLMHELLSARMKGRRVA